MSIARGSAWWIAALRLLALVALAMALLAACSDSTVEEVSPSVSAASEAPRATSTAAAVPGTPLVATADPGIDVGRLFAANCAGCHGAEMKGTDNGPSLLDRAYLPLFHPDEEYVRAVLEGVPAHHWEYGDMPRIDGISRAEAIALTAHIRAAQRAAGVLR